MFQALQIVRIQCAVHCNFEADSFVLILYAVQNLGKQTIFISFEFRLLQVLQMNYMALEVSSVK